MSLSPSDNVEQHEVEPLRGGPRAGGASADRPCTGTPPAGMAERLRLLEAILDGTTDSVFVKDCHGRYLMINAAGAEYVGRPAEQIIGHDDTEVFPAETARQIMADDRHVLTGGGRESFEVNLQINGEPHVFLATKTPYRDSDGQIVGLIGISRDITARKQAEAAQRESEERLARVLESAIDAIVTIDDQRTVRLFNAAAEDVFRCAAADVLGQSFDRLASKQLRELLTRCQRAFERKQVRKRYVWVPSGLMAVRADGETFPIEATISQAQTGTQQLLTIILRDVNDRKRAEDELRKLQLENLYLQEEVTTTLGASEMVGRSEGIQQVLVSAERVARTDSTVLVTGETGTGKELVARAIHAGSDRRKGMLVKVNCAALPSGLVESELFGHEKGAFTGALTRRIGRFEMADGGSIFLDEIGDLPLELQAKLLRVLQEGEFERVGGGETLAVNVRVIAATNRDLAKAVETQEFRADLYYRLNVFPIRIPPLRERCEDIPMLARHFAVQYGQKLGKRIQSIPKETMDALLAYHWPGNVRELQNVIERQVILSTSGVLELGQWPPPTVAVDSPLGADNGIGAASPAGAGANGAAMTLADVERRHILQTLERLSWRVSGPRGAAVALGLKPTTLESRMKRLGLSRRR